MSKMRTDRKPPLARSPMSIRPRRVLQSNPTPPQSPPGSMRTSQKQIRDWNIEEEFNLSPQYHTISWEIGALSKMVNQELSNISATDPRNKGPMNTSLSCDLSSSLFERGKLYDAYSARRNERLKRKKYGEASIEPKSTPYKLGVTVKFSKTKKTVKKTESSAAFVGETNTVVAPRYALRRHKPKLLPLPLPEKPKSLVEIERGRKTALSRVRRI